MEVGGELVSPLPVAAADSLAVIGGCSRDDAVGTVFLGIKNVSFCCFMAAIKIFRRFIGE